VSKYKAEWKPGTANYLFWTEVLVDKKITSLAWDNGRLVGFELDSGEQIDIISNEHSVATLAIKD
jgi:hypothetical protein